MNREAMISVIVTTYNQERTIGRTLDSILRQRCHLPVEIIVGEDCSTDNTRAICQDYAARYPEQIRLFCNERNKGIIDNYFDCLLACRGAYIADCAGDDFWVDDLKLEKEVSLMESDPSIMLVHTAWRSYNEGTQTATDSPRQPFAAPLTDGSQMLEAILTQTRMPVIHLCTALYRAETIMREYHADTTLFRNQQAGCEDLQIAFLMARNGNIAYLPDVTLYYSQGGETVSAPKDERKLFTFYKNVTNLSYSLSEKYGIHSQVTARFFQARVFALLMHAFRAHAPELRDEAITCQKAWKVRDTWKIRLARMVMQGEWSWTMMLRLRKYLR
ncbi:MAG: glycosyltransferase [Prevotella sp.]|nr:glycosyltransferase [Prevotella sp.]